jgi:1,2-dihydroxy-3-keto-5-methylthiopentene dioxygenase
MSILRIFKEDSPGNPELNTSDATQIQHHLAEVGIRFERWEIEKNLSDDVSPEEITLAYRNEIQKLIDDTGYESFDVISMTAEHPQKNALRIKFFAEHTHSEDEIRFFVRGKGLFTMHINNKVYEAVCEKDDLISVPAGTPHWFDMGDSPAFTCIRLFDSPDGWIADYTGSEIAKNFSTLS